LSQDTPETHSTAQRYTGEMGDPVKDVANTIKNLFRQAKDQVGKAVNWVKREKDKVALGLAAAAVALFATGKIEVNKKGITWN